MARAGRIPEPPHGAPARLFALGCLALGVGVLVYLTDRDPSRAALIPAVTALSQSHLFGAVGLWLPSFVHPFAFSLLTAGLQRPGGPPAYGACAMWWSINVGFELAQSPLLSTTLASGLRRSMWPAWLVDDLSNYAAHGTFDVADLIAATAGALAAAMVLRSTHGRETSNAQ